MIAASDLHDTAPGASVETGVVGQTFTRGNLTYEITGIKLVTYYADDG